MASGHAAEVAQPTRAASAGCLSHPELNRERWTGVRAASVPGAPASRQALAIFALLLASYAWFAQGGGWSPNARFGQVRALVEQGTFATNGYLVYHLVPQGGVLHHERFALPARVPPPPDPRVLSTLDLSYFDGRFLPNKPPGTSLLAVPGYFVVSRLAGLAGVDLDGWLWLSVGAWLTSVLSVGLAGALCGALSYRLSRSFFPDLPAHTHVASALTLGLGTLIFPFSTLLMDHVAAAAASFGAFVLLATPRDAAPGPRRLVLAGLVCGAAVLVNYTAILHVALLAGYACWRTRRAATPAWLALGGLAPALFLAWYHAAFFGGVLETANSHQPDFMNVDGGGAFLGMLGWPVPAVAWKLLFSAYRGLFVSCPVLAVSAWGFGWMLRRRGLAPEAWLCISLCAVTLGLNASFNGWYGGYTFGPRYLIPGLPFLAVPLALCFARLPFVTGALATLSTALMLVATSVSPLVPDPVQNPWQEFMAPLAAGGSLVLGREHLSGPVSVNPTGLYESGAHRLYAPESEPSAWNSFNLGELLWPHSWWSVLPLLVLQGAATLALLRAERPAAESPSGPVAEAAHP